MLEVVGLLDFGKVDYGNEEGRGPVATQTSNGASVICLIKYIEHKKVEPDKDLHQLKILSDRTSAYGLNLLTHVALLICDIAPTPSRTAANTLKRGQPESVHATIRGCETAYIKK